MLVQRWTHISLKPTKYQSVRSTAWLISSNKSVQITRNLIENNAIFRLFRQFTLFNNKWLLPSDISFGAKRFGSVPKKMSRSSRPLQIRNTRNTKTTTLFTRHKINKFLHFSPFIGLIDKQIMRIAGFDGELWYSELEIETRWSTWKRNLCRASIK